MRIHIIGGPGSGKSTLARQIALKLNAPHTDLDNIFWDNTAASYGTKRSAESRDQLLSQALGTPSWVIEGVYDKWLMPSFAAANLVIILQTPLWLRQARIVRRFIRRKTGLEKGKKETLKSLRELLAWNASYERENMPRVLKTLQEANLRYLVCKTQQAAMEAVDGIK